MLNTDYKYMIHLGIAEKGKLFCLQGNYKEALRHFKEAIRMTQNQENGDIFFQHYSQCVMETLELSGAYDEVIDYCDKFLEFLESKDENTEIINTYYYNILQKMAIQYALKNENDEAAELLKQANLKTHNVKMSLTKELLNWLQRGFNINKKQIQDLQRKYNYYIIRKDNVNASIAIELPDRVSPF